MNSEDMMKTFRENVVGPALVSQAFLPFLEKAKQGVIVHISSTMGSIETTSTIPGFIKQPSYSITKSALNMLVSTVMFSIKFTPLNIF